MHRLFQWMRFCAWPLRRDDGDHVPVAVRGCSNVASVVAEESVQRGTNLEAVLTPDLGVGAVLVVTQDVVELARDLVQRDRHDQFERMGYRLSGAGAAEAPFP